MAIARYVVSMLAVAAVAACAAPPDVTPSTAGAASAPASSASPAPISASSAPESVASSTSGAVVAWVDRPAPPEVPASPTPLPTDARPCRPADLKVAEGAVGVAMGNAGLPVSFTNVSATTCVLAGYPALAGVSAAGRIVPQDPQQGTYSGDPGPAANIAPGETAALVIGDAAECQGVPSGTQQLTFPRLRITFPAGGFVDVAGVGFGLSCVSVSAFGVPALQPPSSQAPMSLLVAHMDAPSTAVAGQLLRYTVTLTNPTDTAYPLQPCPAYTEFIGSGSDRWVATVKDYYLNCDVVHEIAAHASVTYEMQLRLPADQPATTVAKFGWGLHGGGGPYTGEALAVVS